MHLWPWKLSFSPAHFDSHAVWSVSIPSFSLHFLLHVFAALCTWGQRLLEFRMETDMIGHSSLTNPPSEIASTGTCVRLTLHQWPELGLCSRVCCFLSTSLLPEIHPGGKLNRAQIHKDFCVRVIKEVCKSERWDQSKCPNEEKDYIIVREAQIPEPIFASLKVELKGPRSFSAPNILAVFN